MSTSDDERTPAYGPRGRRRSAHADPFGDEPTPIDPIEAIAHHERRTAADTKQTLKAVQAMRGELGQRTTSTANDARRAVRTIQVLRNELQVSIDKYTDENKLLNLRLDNMVSDQDATRDKVDELNQVVGDLREVTARADGKLDIILRDVQLAKESAAHRERVATDTAGIVEQAEIEDAADRKKHRRMLTIRIVAIIGAVITAILTALGLAGGSSDGAHPSFPRRDAGQVEVGK